MDSKPKPTIAYFKSERTKMKLRHAIAQYDTCSVDTNNLSLQIIDCVTDGEDLAWGVWQNRLATFQVHGNINIRNEIK